MKIIIFVNYHQILVIFLKSMDAFNMQKQTLLKTNSIGCQSIAYLQQRKKQIIIIAQPKAIHLYNIGSQKFQDQLKNPGQSGSISCVTVSDDLFFFAYGMHIAASGYNGKIIFEFDTCFASDKIDRIHVIGYRLWMISGTMLNQFLLAGSQLANKLSRKVANTANKTEDVSSHNFQAKINDSIAVEDQFSKHYLILLKSNNQIICFEDKQLCSYKTTSPPTTIIQYPKSKPTRYLVGTMSGQLIQIQVNKKQIKQIWVLKEGSKGKVNCLLQVKNQYIFVFRDQVMEIWGQDRTLQATEQTQQKYLSAIYIVDKQLLIAGSNTGNLITMQDYTKMMKDYQKKNQNKLKQNLQKQIATLKIQYETLKAKAMIQKKGPVIAQGITVQISTNLDYQLLCSCLELKSDSKITKVMLKGKFTIVKCSKLMFSGKQTNQQFIYTIQEEGTKNTKIWFKSEQKFYKDQKMKIMVYGQKDTKTYGITRSIDLKPLCYHHKIAKFEPKQYNQLNISGQFKYFEMNLHLNLILNDFGSASQSGDTFNQAYYQSIITKQKLIVRYKNKQCEIKSVDPAPLIVIKQFLVQKSRQKNLNFNYSTQLNIQSVKNMVNDLQKIIKPFQQLKRQVDLLPGLMEIKNDQNLSEDLKRILQRSQQINQKQKQSQTQYQNLLNQLRQMYVSYQKLKQHEVTSSQLDWFNRQLNNFDSNKIISLILS